MTQITLVEGDITEQQVDVVVNAANTSLLGGGGVDGAIHRKGGPEILAACRELRASHYGKGLPVGRAVATTAGRLPARWVVHTVGPVHRAEDYEERAGLLASCHRESLRLAVELGARTVAFPAISTGVYQWPVEDAARIALTAVAEVLEEAPGELEEVRFVLFGRAAYETFEQVRSALGQRS
ncbi:O-acetyl-ADP-ribose deacetylase [Kitasatospora sp. McL0602]|uniref:O-acetyl-ADP-ribose deacetylase n=1 Tax=Kitasatospora sp. McL0602 TaxID=3439530 RepID=UPI003F88756E